MSPQTILPSEKTSVNVCRLTGRRRGCKIGPLRSATRLEPPLPYAGSTVRDRRTPFQPVPSHTSMVRPMLRPPRSLLAPVVAVLLVRALSPVPATGQIPGVPIGGHEPSARTQWSRHAASLADSLVRDWITVAERREHDTLARLFTDRAVLITAAGERAEGRDQIRELLDQLPQRVQHQAQRSGVVLGMRLLYTSGRVRLQEDGVEKTETFSVLMEQHHGHWQIRALAFAAADPALAQAPMPREALTPRERRVAAPERTLVRLIVEPAASREFQREGNAGAPSERYGGGVGLEINRALELRGFGWQQADHDSGQTLSSYGAEGRLHLFEHWRLRPFLSFGAARFAGAGAPDTAWVPTVGGGISVRAFSHLDVQLSLRNHLVTTPDGVQSSSWIVEKRTQRPEVSMGLSFALGNRPQWRDRKPDEVQQLDLAEQIPGVLAVLAQWASALDQDDATADAVYGSGAILYHDGRALRGGERMLTAAREEGLGTLATPEVVAASVSNDVAYVESRFSGVERERRVLSILQREEGAWKVQAQLLL